MNYRNSITNHKMETNTNTESTSAPTTTSHIKSCNVTDKVHAILVCEHVKDTTTTKPGREGTKYLAINKLNPNLVDKINNGILFKVTIKVDGTCCIIWEGRIWKRRDLKSDRDIPKGWIQTGDKNNGGHLIGIMPLDNGDKWHLDCYVKNPDTTLNMDKINIIDLNEEQNGLIYKEVDTASLNGQSIEIMGPRFQKNPHKLKMHCAMRHGLVQIKDFPNLIDNADILQDIKNWFSTSEHGPFAEGIVLHLDDGSMFKLHRHHLDMKWDVDSILPLDTIKL